MRDWYRRHGIAIQRVLSDNCACYKDRFTLACAGLTPMKKLERAA